MKKALILGLLILICSSADWAQKNERALNEIVSAEQAFAQTAAEKGTKAAFLEFVAPEGIVFANDKPENGREVWEKRTANHSLLAWQPTLADVSADGDLGYTTGNWEFRSKGATDAPVAWGEYFTIWRRQPDGKWKFDLDIGIRHESAPVVKNAWKSSAIKSTAQSADIKNRVQILEKQFELSLAENGLVKTYEKFASAEIRLLRENQMPINGRKNAVQWVKNQNATMKTSFLGGSASRSEDLIYTYGEYELTAKDGKILDKGYFTRVWKYEPKGLRLVIDLAYPPPPPQK
ncbi:MAG: nuclear transport factor 2 family protein [Pyrinomonadaceae bacterium]